MMKTYSLLMIVLCLITVLSCSTESTPTYTLTITASPDEGGVISPNTGSFDEGETVSLQATPAEGWLFSRWEQDLNTTANPINITMDGNYNVVGVFERLWPVDTETEVVDVTNPATGQTWMDRNLGASRAATSMDDEQAYGDLYQWGRAADGHEKRTSGTTTTLSSTDQLGHGNFILAPNDPNDWRSPQNDNLWQGVTGINNPCPAGYRLPTESEWEAERQSWSSNDRNGAFASPLKLPVAGFRLNTSGSPIFDAGISGLFWSGAESGTIARFLGSGTGNASMGSLVRASGFSVRCIKD